MRRSYLIHHGIKGQKWGVRRYQNEDGSLTDEGRARYGVSVSISNKNAEDKRQKHSDMYGVKQDDISIKSTDVNKEKLKRASAVWKANPDWFEDEVDMSNKAHDKFSPVTKKAAEISRSEGPEKATEYILESMKDYSYDYSQSMATLENGKKEVMTMLTVYGEDTKWTDITSDWYGDDYFIDYFGDEDNY